MKYENEREKYEALLDVTRQLGGVHTSNELLRTIVALAKELLHADRGFALLREGTVPPVSDHADEVKIETTGGFQREATHAMLQISGSVLRNVLDTGERVLTIDAQRDDRFGAAESLVIHGIRSVACAPMKVRDRILGVLYLDWRGAEASLDQRAMEFLEALATQAAVALDNLGLAERLEAENRSLRAELARPPELIGESPAMRCVFELMEKILPTDASVLILGESGTGKELVARALHARGPRARRAFVAQFCGALPETLLESELFGHKKGSFTGAISDKKGLFELADGGTFFLDEIADTSLSTQTKLLRVLEEGEFRPVGDTRTVHADVRIVAATNRDMSEALRQGQFREDLFYRLNVFTLTMPPLRDRGRDVLLIADRFVQHFTDELGLPPKDLSSDTRRLLQQYVWPGNVRELRNVIHRAVLVSETERIECRDLGLDSENHDGRPPGEVFEDSDPPLDDIVRKIVLERLASFDGNRTKTAKSLGVSLRWLHYRLKDWNG